MRKILFRGKHKDSGEWVEGVPYFENNQCFMITDLFICEEYQCTGAENVEVIPETVGQYTGLEDKNGKMIFEGDILSYIDCDGNTQFLEIGFKDGYFCYIEEGNEDDNELHALLTLDPIVCGNIHDNPELLKGE